MEAKPLGVKNTTDCRGGIPLDNRVFKHLRKVCAVDLIDVKEIIFRFPLLRVNAVVHRVCEESVQLAVLVRGAALREAMRWRGLASADQLAELLAAEWRKWCDLIPAAHAVRWQGLNGCFVVGCHICLPLHVAAEVQRISAKVRYFGRRSGRIGLSKTEFGIYYLNYSFRASGICFRIFRIVPSSKGLLMS